MEKIGVYVNGNARIPQRFWLYILITDLKKAECMINILKIDYKFDQKNTDLYNSLSIDERKKINFLYVDGEKQF